MRKPLTEQTLNEVVIFHKQKRPGIIRAELSRWRILGSGGPLTEEERYPGDFQQGDLVGNTYVVTAYVGRGAMGHVYRVHHERLDADYALKTLSADRISDIAWKRFQNEAKAMAMLNHPNVVNIYDLGLHGGNLPFYVMDLLEGEDLAQILSESGPPPAEEAARIFLEVFAGINFAHKKGIIHRDIKPGNIFLLKQPGSVGERVKILDFGIAKLSEPHATINQELTTKGDAVGTPCYMSPEQCMGQRVDTRSDIYSLGCTLFETLTGNPPFRSRNPTETMMMQLSAVPATLTKATGGKSFPEELETLVAKMLEKQPPERYQTVEQAAKDLAAIFPQAQAQTQAPQQSTTGEKIRSQPATQATSVIPTSQPTASMQPQAPRQTRTDIEYTGDTLPTVSLLKKLKLPLVAIVALTTGAALTMLASSLFSADTDKNRSIHETATAGSKTEHNDANDFERQTAAIEEAKTPAIGGNNRYSTVKQVNGKTVRDFEFPSDISIGRISADGTNFVQAKGHVTMPIDAGMTFEPSAVCANNPTYMAPFREGDIYTLLISPEADDPAMLTAASKIPGIMKLDFFKSKIFTDPPQSELNSFKKLDVYVGSSNETNGEALAKATCWNNLHQLYLPFSKNIHPLLCVIQKINIIKMLGLGPAHLTWNDYKMIATFNNLVYLDLNGNKVTNRELQVLGVLGKLETLNLLNSDIDIDALPTLLQFKKLKRLYLSSPRLNKEDIAKIKTALPKADIRKDWN